MKNRNNPIPDWSLSTSDFTNEEIHYSFLEGPFGKMIIASTQNGLCSLSPYTEKESAVEQLRKMFPKSPILFKEESLHATILSYFHSNQDLNLPLKLHLKGTEFQIKVWMELLKIPMGKLVTYGEIARQINHSKAYRAVGTAIGHNPIFFIIPCHRVIQAGGAIGNYLWGTEMKRNIIRWESMERENR